MCAIVGSFSPDKFKELVVLNSYRGNFSHSISAIGLDCTMIALERGFGPLTDEMIDEFISKYPGNYYLGHIQAPTGGLVHEAERIHPAVHNGNTQHFMWHNGILKNRYIKELQSSLRSKEVWDTKLMLEHLLYSESLEKGLEGIDGTFSCVLLSDVHSMLLFRNVDSPMFYDTDMNLSSTKFDVSISTTEDTIYNFDINDKKVITVSTWKPKFSSPYFFG